MSSPDGFYTIQKVAKIELKVKGSKFIGRAIPCLTPEEAEEILKNTRKEYYDATHHCYAYQTGLGPTRRFRYSDSGEPSGTAGKPIYDQIKGKKLTNLIVIVTRYFGGTKLGTGGLTHAYSQAAGEVIAGAGMVQDFVTEEFTLLVSYNDYNAIERLTRKCGGQILKRGSKGQISAFSIKLRKSLVREFKEMALDVTSGRVKFG
ncbi:MAG: IMPACT family protein [candidate division Zixibacteria bacterium]|nr:IMPACT family protein [candidate division Zixibacteria bacterium]